MKKCYRCNKYLSEKEWKKCRRIKIFKNAFGEFEIRLHSCGYRMISKIEKNKWIENLTTKF